MRLGGSGPVGPAGEDGDVVFAYRRASAGGFAETVEALERAIDAERLVVRCVQDLHETLASKGFAIHPLRIYEIELEHRIEDTRKGVLPCKVNVAVEGDTVVVTAVPPGVLRRLYEDGSNETADMDELVERLVDAAVA